MDVLNKKLDHVLSTLIKYQDVICLMYYKSGENGMFESGITPEFNEMFEGVGLSNERFIELLEILQQNKYIVFKRL